ncbi:hypothetical protein ACFVVM_32960 [Nocardia sp. NPDC058176]|uniref:hypothetical protein n=1 Tax=Nocardia sp. NPDC058176 TaxID=3346368 RepID=UPI0036DED59A
MIVPIAIRVNQFGSYLLDLSKKEPLMPLSSVTLERHVLYHGSATPGIDEFDAAEEDTLGTGVYLTDEAAARGYAHHRAQHGGVPVLYRVEVEKARLIDLTDQSTVTAVMNDFRQDLVVERHRVLADQTGSWAWPMALDQLIDEIDSGRGTEVGAVKLVTQRSGELFTKHLSERGFDGVYAWEGGEGSIGNHRTYVISNPAAVRKLGEQLLESPVPEKAPGRAAVVDRRTPESGSAAVPKVDAELVGVLSALRAQAPPSSRQRARGRIAESAPASTELPSVTLAPMPAPGFER